MLGEWSSMGPVQKCIGDKRSLKKYTKNGSGGKFWKTVAEVCRQNGLMYSSPQDFKDSKDTVVYS